MFIYMKSYLFVLSILRKKRWSQSFKWHLLVVKKRFIAVRELVRKLLRIEAAEIVMKNVTITNRKIITLYNLYSMKKERILLPGCTSNSKFKGNIIYHMKDCGEQLKRKEEKSGNKKMPVLWKTIRTKVKQGSSCKQSAC